jgi:HEAT repeat protein
MVAGNGRKNADDRLALELASGKTITEAAQLASVSERTAHRRLDDSSFRGRLKTLRAPMVDHATGRLANHSTRAVDTLAALLTAESETVRLGAARAIVELGTKLREATEFEQRISELEMAVKNGNLKPAN